MGFWKEKEGYVLVSAVNVANNFINKGLEENIEITPLKLQKLVYFLFKHYYKDTNQLLFTENFETWKYGPVLPSIYSEFSSYGNEPIKTYAKDSKSNVYAVEEKGAFKTAFDYVWERYKNFTGSNLSELTHKPGTAWTKAKEKQNPFLDIEDIKNEPNL